MANATTNDTTSKTTSKPVQWVGIDHVQVAIPVIVKTKDGTPLSGVIYTQRCRLLGECPIAVVDEHAGRVIIKLCFRSAVAGRKTIYVIEVKVTIVIKISKTRTPAPVAYADAG